MIIQNSIGHTVFGTVATISFSMRSIVWRVMAHTDTQKMRNLSLGPRSLHGKPDHNLIRPAQRLVPHPFARSSISQKSFLMPPIRKRRFAISSALQDLRRPSTFQQPLVLYPTLQKSPMRPRPSISHQPVTRPSLGHGSTVQNGGRRSLWVRSGSIPPELTRTHRTRGRPVNQSIPPKRSGHGGFEDTLADLVATFIAKSILKVVFKGLSLIMGMLIVRALWREYRAIILDYAAEIIEKASRDDRWIRIFRAVRLIIESSKEVKATNPDPTVRAAGFAEGEQAIDFFFVR